MNSSVKNGKLPLNKTNYFNNLKKKTGCKDIKEQERFNKELLNCIDILCNRVSFLEGIVIKQAEELVGLKKRHNAAFAGLGDYLNDEIVPRMKDMMDYMPDEFKEKWFVKEVDVTVEDDDSGDGQEGGESMDAET